MIRSLRASVRLRAPSTPLPLRSLQHLPVCFPFSDEQEKETKSLTAISRRNYSMTTRNENALILGGVSILAVAGGLHVGMSLYNQYQQNKSSAPPAEESTTANTTDEKSKVDETATKASSTKTKGTKDEQVKTEETAGSGFFGNFFATTFYDGGFGESPSR